MDLSELTAYAESEHQIREEHKWNDFPGFSVLSHPATGRWLALLIREWDPDSGSEHQHCDMKCGREPLSDFRKPWLGAPVRMTGRNWIGITFNSDTEADLVFRLFDLALAIEEGRGYTIVLEGAFPPSGTTEDAHGQASENAGRRPAEDAGRQETESVRRNPTEDASQYDSDVFKGNHRPAGSGPGISSISRGGTAGNRELPLSTPGGRPVSSSSRSGSGTDRPLSGIYKETPIPAAGSRLRPPARPSQQVIPERLRQLRRLYVYGRETLPEKARNFYRQAQFMADYEDDQPWKGSFEAYFPTYQDLTSNQLRGYFTWRTQVRRGEFCRIPSAAAMIYVYELLNGIGSSSPAQALQKLEDFRLGYLESGIRDPSMHLELKRLMLEYCVIQEMPASVTRRYASAELMKQDEALGILRQPTRYGDDEVFDALCQLSRKSPAGSAVIEKEPARGRHLFSEAWRKARSEYRREGKDLFTLCFGEEEERSWYPLSGAVWYRQEVPEDRIYFLNECRSYSCRQGSWQTRTYLRVAFDRDILQSFLHETDRLLRQYLKTGRALRRQEAGAFATPYVTAVIEADRQAALEAARPKINIDLSSLDRIRRDSLSTQESLLAGIEEEEFLPGRALAEPAPKDTLLPDMAPADTALAGLAPTDTAPAGLAPADTSQGGAFSLEAERNHEAAGTSSAAEVTGAVQAARSAGATETIRAARVASAAGTTEVAETAGTAEVAGTAGLPLNSLQIRVLRALLRDDALEADSLLREQHLMPTIVADGINEALYDEFGDVVISCDNDRLSLVEDYAGDLAELLGPG